MSSSLLAVASRALRRLASAPRRSRKRVLLVADALLEGLLAGERIGQLVAMGGRRTERQRAEQDGHDQEQRAERAQAVRARPVDHVGIIVQALLLPLPGRSVASQPTG